MNEGLTSLQFLGTVYVNVVDLIDSRREGTQVRRFPSMAALQRYTTEESRGFPRVAAKRDGFLYALMWRTQ